MVTIKLVRLKTEALALRREIEALASQLWAPVIGEQPQDVWVKSIERRLVLVVAHVSSDNRNLAVRAALKLGHVYRETSDVIHGRSNVAHFNMNRVAEWQADLERFSELLVSGQTSGSVAPVGPILDAHLVDSPGT